MADEELPEKYTLTTAEGESLESSWDFTGTGRAAYTNGDVYEGQYQDGKKHGQGVYTSRDGSVYTGGYENDQRSGQGKQTSTDGSVFEGNFANGQRSGQGSCKYANGDVYTGEWSNGQKNGSGIYQYVESKHRLVGSWSNGKLGAGQLELPDGKKLCGTFQDNQPNGEMIWTADDGSVTSCHNYVQTKYPINDGETAVTAIRLSCQ